MVYISPIKNSDISALKILLRAISSLTLMFIRLDFNFGIGAFGYFNSHELKAGDYLILRHI